MLIRNWEDVGLTRDDFQKLWDLPSGEFKRRMEVLRKSKTKETFFPKVEYRVRLIKEQVITVTGDSEADCKMKVFGAPESLFTGVEIDERTVFERIY